MAAQDLEDLISDALSESFGPDWNARLGAKWVAEIPIIAAANDLREALTQMVEEKCDYMSINNLGDPGTQHTVKAARAALASCDTHRMAETGTGSGRSLSGAVPNASEADAQKDPS